MMNILILFFFSRIKFCKKSINKTISLNFIKHWCLYLQDVSKLLGHVIVEVTISQCT